MIDINLTDAIYLIPLLLLLVMIVTHSYKNDYTLTTVVLSSAIGGYLHKINPTYTLFVIYAVLAILVFRAIINHHRDKWVKR